MLNVKSPPKQTGKLKNTLYMQTDITNDLAVSNVVSYAEFTISWINLLADVDGVFDRKLEKTVLQLSC